MGAPSDTDDVDRLEVLAQQRVEEQDEREPAAVFPGGTRRVWHSGTDSDVGDMTASPHL